MASSPRPDMAPRKRSALRPWLWLAAIVALTLVIVMIGTRLAGDAGSDAPGIATNYADAIERRGLQLPIDYLDADADWRARANLPDTNDSASVRFPWLAALTLAKVLLWMFYALAAGVLIFIIYLAVRHGVGLRVDSRKIQDVESAPKTAMSGPGIVDQPLLTLEEIARLTDAAKALGALQRLVLAAAAEATGSALRRSETAREVLRRLPRDWTHYRVVATLVQTAERVRYAGQSIDASGVEGLIADARPVLVHRTVTA
ncbi:MULTISPECIES: DUF4129 domain-containing protein [Maricaulis]|jgi:hypothetical protein|uniref:DUF4129 domain-containing protein n=1 Tax=Maricaulis TaxID=74317 RepID=UPI000C5B5BB0|nr:MULTISPECIES: DUF4129 domain-containing protein [Maricaulis]MAC90039.1 hypothetical protein [Maricaulis sp.]